MKTDPNTITIAGRIDVDSLLDLTIHVKKHGWSFNEPPKFAKNGSVSLLVVIPEDAEQDKLDINSAIKGVINAIPNFDGVVLSTAELESLCNFPIDEDEPRSSEEKWW